MFLNLLETNDLRQAAEANNRGLTRYSAGDTGGALEDFQEAARLQSDYPEAWNNAGIVLQQMGQLDEAMTHFDRAVALRYDYVDALNNRGRLRQLRGDLTGAAKDLDLALSSANEPMTATVLHNRAVLRQAAGDLASALADFNRALEVVPDCVVTLRARGLARKAVDADGALDDLDRAVQLTPPAEAAAVLHERGGVKVLFNDWVGAIADYDRALSLDPKFWLAWVSRGHARYHRRDFGGVTDYRRALRLNPRGAIREIARFVQESAAQDPHAVLENCAKHLRINDRDAIAHARRCLTLAFLHRDAEAAEELECFRELVPDLADALAQMLKAVGSRAATQC